ncbi:ECF RNA polymerase sigma factor SigL [bacterium HR29]|jgi:RNA polymerase sigma-70 factor (ECF subfamily)|nr:ECF RNA polymerase sigma factor SigL [bacterium HR29]
MAGFASGAFLRLAEAIGASQSAEWTPSPAVEALRNRDPIAWTHLFEREAPAIYRYVIARVGSPEEAEDLVSRTFEEAWKHAEAFEDRGLPPRAWLFGIARHLTSSHRRRLFRQPPVLRLDVVEQAARERDPELLDLARAIARLPRADAEVVVLRFVHGLSAHETAAALGTTVDAVKSRQARALRKLRHALEAAPAERAGLAAKEG